MESTESNTTLITSPSNLDRATMAATSDMVRLLFGLTTSCWGSFTCSHAKIPGRLYAVTKAILFYSNVLGFERRICLQFSEVESISLHRTTSLRIELVSEEVYVFKSFEDREQVLQLLLALKRLEFKERRRQGFILGIGDESGMLTDDERSYDSDVDSIHESIRSLQLPSSTPSPPRQRAASDSVVRLIGYEDRGVESIQQQSEELVVTPPIEENRKESWNEVNFNRKKLEHTGIDKQRLACSLQDFFETFLADNSPHSLDRFQREDVQDKDVAVSSWKGESGVFSRELTFRHQIKSSFGPSEAPTKRNQRMKRFEANGITLENTTEVAGIPASDAFVVQDYWVIEADGPNHVTLSAYFAPVFTKRTMFKGLIEKSVKQETMGWFEAYIQKVEKILEPRLQSVGTDILATELLNGMVLPLASNLQALRPWLIIIATMLTLILIVLLLHLIVVWQSLHHQATGEFCPHIIR